MLQRVTLRRSDFILPVFVREGKGEKREVASMPGVFQMSIDVAPTGSPPGRARASGRTLFSA